MITCKPGSKWLNDFNLSFVKTIWNIWKIFLLRKMINLFMHDFLKSLSCLSMVCSKQVKLLHHSKHTSVNNKNKSTFKKKTFFQLNESCKVSNSLEILLRSFTIMTSSTFNRFCPFWLPLTTSLLGSPWVYPFVIF